MPIIALVLSTLAVWTVYWFIRMGGVDHFRAKLLNLHDGFQTQTGARLAAERTRVLTDFVTSFEAEIGAESDFWQD